MKIGMFLGLVVGLIAIYLVVKPLLISESHDEYWIMEEDSQNWGNDTVFAVLAEIEYDYQMGKMSNKDYQLLQQKYQRQAVDLLQNEEDDLDKLSLGSKERQLEAELEAELEEELDLIRKKAKAKEA